jgi:hypothetical protein
LGEDEQGRDLHLGRSRKPFFLCRSGKTLIGDRLLRGEGNFIGDLDGSQDFIGRRRRLRVSGGAFLVLRRWIPFLEILFRQNFSEIPMALGGFLDGKSAGEIGRRSDG